MQVNVHEARTQLSRLLELGSKARRGDRPSGQPVAKLIPARRKGIAHWDCSRRSARAAWRRMVATISDGEIEDCCAASESAGGHALACLSSGVSRVLSSKLAGFLRPVLSTGVSLARERPGADGLNSQSQAEFQARRAL